MTTLVKLGEKIDDLRKRRALTQEALAGHADMDRSAKAAGCGFGLTFQFKQLILHAK